MPDEHDHRAEPEPSPPPTEAVSAAATIGEAAAPGQPPLITAFEIENFKGVGRPVRVDLRPITLLFGRNSAGKSTILHALCYAYEVLSHRAVDARKTELGGDQIDLGGFRSFVHGHDLNQPVRLRFELNLEGWRVPEPLLENMKRELGPDEALIDEWADRFGCAGYARSGWVELAVAWSRSSESPALAGYEVGVDESLIGRIRTDDLGNIALELNWGHRLFDCLSQGPDCLHGAVRLRYPLPAWDEVLGVDLAPETDPVEANIGGPNWQVFQALISGPLVGVGDTVRNELAKLRYMGPVRELHPQTDVESGMPDRGAWSDGSAAWSRLLHHDPTVYPSVADPLDDVNDWLARAERLDTGYRLRRRSTVELDADEPPVSRIRRHERLFGEYRDEDGAVDFGKWRRRLAEIVSPLAGCDPDDVESRIAPRRDDKGRAGSMEGSDQDNAPSGRVIESARKHGRDMAEFVAAITALEEGRPPSAVKALVRAIAVARSRTTLQLLTVGSQLPVRTSDIGVGVSQILPVVVAALDPDRPGITAIEQPEFHVHPKMQVELGDLFAQGVDQGGVFLIETHSEHLMLRRIEETHSGELPEGNPPLRPDQVSVVFVEQINGEVRTTPLRIDETGEFKDRWPHGFFHVFD